MGLGKISVGPPYFDTVFVPLMAPLVFLMGIGPLARWKRTELPEIARRLRWALVVALLATAAQALLLGGRPSWLATLGLLLAWWVVASLGVDAWERLAPRSLDTTASAWSRLKALPRALVERGPLVPRSVLAMWVAHFGIAVFIFGVTMVKSGEIERDVKMDVGDTTEVLGYTFAFRGVDTRMGPNYRAAHGTIEVMRDGKAVITLHPEKRNFAVTGATMTEAAIDTGFTRDLYVSLGEPLAGSDAWIVRVYVKPFVAWIWGGCLIMAFGGFLAATDRRYRSKVRQTQGTDSKVTA
jgi:cytochrome c-type biogenesis protein CcmF